jgi:hypothetical protein
MQWLYDKEEYADRLDAEVSRAKGWPVGGTQNWSDPRMIEQGDLQGMWYVAAPLEDVREQVRSECPPDKVAEHSSDWHPELDLV